MANFVYITLDTTAPSTPQILLENGATFASAQLINAYLSTGTNDAYQMKIWGDLDITWAKANGLIKSASTATTSVDDAEWISFSAIKQIKLTAGDGQKNISFMVRDDVYNESDVVSDSITLDTTRPVATTTSPDVSKISKNTGKNVASFSFTVDSDFTEYKVKVVSATGASHDTGVQLGTVNGSQNVAGTGAFSNATPINVQITGADLELASAGDGQKIVKVFIKDAVGNWSV